MTNTNRIQNIALTDSRQQMQTRVTTPAGFHVLVSTIILRLGEYETMTFAADETGKVTNWTELDCNRYSTELGALRGHTQVVTMWYETTMTELPTPYNFDEEN